MSSQIDHLLNETRRFAPSGGLRREGRRDRGAVRRGGRRPRGVLGRAGPRRCTGTRRSREVLDWSNPPFAKWFDDGELNVAYNCLDRHVEAGNGDRVALLWEGEPGDARRVTYAELTDEVKRLANVLEGLGIGEGDRVAIYMPMIPEAIAAMLAVARHRRDPLRRLRRLLGRQPALPHRRRRREARHHRRRRIPQGQGLAAQARRRHGARPTATAPACRRRSSTCSSSAAAGTTSTGPRAATSGGTMSCPAASAEHEAQAFPAENPLFILYTSGTTGKPKGILHTSGGYLTQAAFTNKVVHDIHPESDVFWCTADIGWVTGHSYVTYGPLANGATQVLYEGTPDTPHPGRWWEIVAEVRRHDPLHRAHRHPLVHEARPGDPEEVRPLVAAPARLGGRADQPRGVDVVPQDHRRQDGADRRHVVADRDRRDHDLGAARRDRDQARLGAGAASRHLDRRRRRGRHPRRQRQRRPARGHRALAEHAARHLGRPGAVRRDVLGEVPEAGLLLRRRRRAARRGRRRVAARPRRRRHERVGPPPVDDRDRVGAGRERGRRRGRGGRRVRRDDRSGGRRVRHHQAVATSPSTPPTASRRRCARGSASRSARSRARATSTSSRSCRRPAPARSCAACCGMSRRAARSATPRRSPTPP